MDNELTEQDVYTAFGIEPEEDSSAAPRNDTGEAAPEETGAPDTEDAADDAETPAEERSLADARDDRAEAETEAGEKREQTVEERRANAARRRERERKEAVDRAVAEERARAQAEQQRAVDAVYRKLGYADEADYLAKQAEEQAAVRGRALRRLGLSKEEGDLLFPQKDSSASPRNDMERASARNDMEQGGARDNAEEAAAPQREEAPFEGGPDALERQLAEIHKLDPTVKTLEDLNAKPWAQEMAQALASRQFGTDEDRLLRAYKVFAQEDIINARLREARKAGRQEALNQQAGKEHLAPYSQRSGGGLPEVPRDSLQAYRQLMPGLSYEQYQQLYADAIKRTS